MATTKKEGYKKIHLPRARRGEERDLFVGINGVNYIVPKGIDVEVPDFVYDEIMRSQAAEDKMWANVDAILAGKKGPEPEKD